MMIVRIKTSVESLTKLFNFSKENLLSIEECRKEVIRLKIKNLKEYHQKKKKRWPFRPDKCYKNKGWISWNHFFNREKMISFEHLKKKVIKAGIKSKTDYQKKRKNNWPSHPERSKEWISWSNFLGK